MLRLNFILVLVSFFFFGILSFEILGLIFFLEILVVVNGRMFFFIVSSWNWVLVFLVWLVIIGVIFLIVKLETLLVIGLVWDFVVFFVSFLVLDCILVIEVFFFFWRFNFWNFK